MDDVVAKKSSEFKAYPFLTHDEFAETCHHLDRRYRQATLGPVRRQWRLDVRTALGVSFGMHSEYDTYMQIIRPLEGELDHGDLAAQLDSLSFGASQGSHADPPAEDQDMMDMVEEADDPVISKQPAKPDFGYVTYEIHLHPTYRVPCLWLTLHGLPADEPAFDIDTVFRRLVPDQFKAGLRAPGGIGGISADHHPLTGIPSFFVHPCLIGDSMQDFDCSKADYLMVWLGLVGGVVGLWVPKEMALD